MYKKFFGLKERPFKLVPNPAYLYLSKSHEVALAHLTYAISQGDGFVEITGEVGTGKTTLCRAFLENLDEKTEAAYIFNPKLDAVQLLRAINDEFGISSEGKNTKDLIDTLNSFLMEKKKEGKNVILLIDEAQNLNKEVLEQLRLLSNLETTTSKLIQIILVGQPELGEMLDSQELRQLGQRITLSCHLSPLSYKETREYINHRLQVASQRPGIKFYRSALRSIYKYSGGIPRLINIACDRILLTAFGLNRRRITSSIARASIKELANRGDVKRFSLLEGRKAALFLSMLCLIVLIVILYHPGDGNINTNTTHMTIERKKPEKVKPKKIRIKTPKKKVPAKKRVEKEVQKAKEPEPVINPPQKLDSFLRSTDPSSSRSTALKVAMEMWGDRSEISPYLESRKDDASFFQVAALQNGLLIHCIEGDLDLVKKLDLPAIMEFYLPGDPSPRYLTLTKIDNKKFILKGGQESGIIEVEQDALGPYWSGAAYILWKNFLNYRGVIPREATRSTIITLKMLLQDIGFRHIKINPFYDRSTRDAVREIQKRHGITQDGVVGPLTKIVIYNEKISLKIPHINASEQYGEGRKGN